MITSLVRDGFWVLVLHYVFSLLFPPTTMSSSWLLVWKQVKFFFFLFLVGGGVHSVQLVILVP